MNLVAVREATSISGARHVDPTAAPLLADEDLRNVVSEAVVLLKSVFDGPVDVELLADPEDPSDEGIVMVSAIASMSHGQALEMIDQIEETWWVENCHRGGGRFSIDVRGQ